MIGTVLAVLGLLLLYSRWYPRKVAANYGTAAAAAQPLVSIIVPARNEAKVLPALLDSLLALTYENREIIVVDDRSEDATATVVRGYASRGVRLVSSRPKPERWGGKQWACHQGALGALGTVLLFTDADTVHSSASLSEAVLTLSSNGGGMLTALPFHRGTSWWERLTGPFHVLLLTITAPLAKPRPGRVFAIGQYLLFARDAYNKIGGHAAVKAELVEDLPLANRCLRANIPYTVCNSWPRLYQVRMYESLADFTAGWRRNLRAGLGQSTLLAPVEITLLVAALTGAFKVAPTSATTFIGAASILLVGAVQRRLGAFSLVGAIFFPFAVGLFCFVTAAAAFDMIRKKPMVWKGRSYPAT